MERIPLSPPKKLWDEIPAEQYCSAVTDGTHGTPCPQKTGYRLVTSKNIVNGRLDLEKTYFISASDYAEINLRSKVDITDILISMIGTVGAVCYIDNQPNFAIKNIGLFKNKDAIHGKWLFYFLKSPDGQERIRKSIRGTTQQYIPLGELRKLSIKYPKSLSEMEKIVSLLSSLDDKIELNTQINHNLEEQAKAIFKSWFVDFEPFQNGKFVDSELGRIPHGWSCGTLKDLLEVKYGKDHKKLSDGKIPVYGSGGLMRYAEKSIYSGESVLIPRKGTLNNVMRVSGDFWTVDTMFYSIPKKTGAVKYLYHILSGLDLASMNSGSAVPSMTTDILNAIKIILPPDEILTDFDRQTSALWSSREVNVKQSAQLACLRDTLLPKLMSGEIDVSEIEM